MISWLVSMPHAGCAGSTSHAKLKSEVRYVWQICLPVVFAIGGHIGDIIKGVCSMKKKKHYIFSSQP